MDSPVAFNAAFISIELQRFEGFSKKDVLTLVSTTKDVVGKFQGMGGLKKLCERLASATANGTLDLADTATRYGVKKFLREPPPLDKYIEQLKMVRLCFNQYDVGTLAAVLQRKDVVNAHIDSVMRDLQGAYSGAKNALVSAYSPDEMPFDLYEEAEGDKGGYSDVVVGYWRPLTSPEFQKVAVKHIRPKGIDLLRTPEPEVRERMLKRLRREAEPWKSVNHPHILPFLGYSVFPHWILLSPWCDNGDLPSYLHRNGSANRLRLLAQAATGLHWLHTQLPPIVHADVKPDNILVNGIHEAVIADFGLSKIIREGPSGFTTEQAGQGTIIYMAPEQHDDTTADVTTAIDIYAFTLILSGQRPFRNVRKHIVLAVQAGERPVQEDHPDLACAKLWDLFICGWDESPDVRPSLDIFIHRLTELADTRYPWGESGQESPPPPEAPERDRDTGVPVRREVLQNFFTSLLPPRTASLPSSNTATREVHSARDTTRLTQYHAPAPFMVINEQRRFRREANIRKDLRHPNVLALLQTFDDPEMCLVSPWCKNGNISSYLHNNPDADKLRLLIQVADALDYLHTGNTPIIHGNLSPENIYIDDAGNVLVSGFSTSMLLSDTTAENAPLVWSVVQEICEDISNMRYLAPEVVNGQDWSTASDVYTLALVTLEILSGTKPFPTVTSRNRLVILISRAQGPLFNDHWDPEGHRERLWPYLQQWWSPIPNERPSARVVREALGAYSQDPYNLPPNPTTMLPSFPTVHPSVPFGMPMVAPVSGPTMPMPYASPSPPFQMPSPGAGSRGPLW
ncbi:hypothetical protein FRB99_006272 [Tulasnella sp. 403]|nr:hypothetical protein FRB99_006272 [Tulasnella sp. 403]